MSFRGMFSGRGNIVRNCWCYRRGGGLVRTSCRLPEAKQQRISTSFTFHSHIVAASRPHRSYFTATHGHISQPWSHFGNCSSIICPHFIAFSLIGLEHTYVDRLTYHDGIVTSGVCSQWTRYRPFNLCTQVRDIRLQHCKHQPNVLWHRM